MDRLEAGKAGREKAWALLATLNPGPHQSATGRDAGHYKRDYDAGRALIKATDVVKLRGLHKLAAENFDADNWKSAAFILGSASIKLTLADLAAEVHQLMHGQA
ncbi:hypothetical protein [Polaromonas sp. YR568]|uniref:hypothetical protein n=1 Tax=Polaromonas sp. YR568 TaxID=1855301 RepID=UPI00398BC161